MARKTRLGQIGIGVEPYAGFEPKATLTTSGTLDATEGADSAAFRASGPQQQTNFPWWRAKPKAYIGGAIVEDGQDKLAARGDVREGAIAGIFGAASETGQDVIRIAGDVTSPAPVTIKAILAEPYSLPIISGRGHVRWDDDEEVIAMLAQVIAQKAILDARV